MRARCGLLLVAVICTGQSPQRANSPQIGVYLGWVSLGSGNRLRSGAELAKKSGFQTIRLPLVSSVENDFGISASCDDKRPLDDLIALPEYAEILGDPKFRTIFLTTWGDSNSYKPCTQRDPHSYQHSGKLYLDKKYYDVKANRDRMRDEYARLTYKLYKSYRGTGRTFGIANWEGDNDLYCNSAYYFAMVSEFRTSCEQKRKTEDVLAAYKNYLTLRQEGIVQGQARASREGLTGVSVISVVEMSALRMLKEKHLPDMLDDVIPSLPPADYVSYSAWESIALPPGQLLHDLEELQKRFQGRLIVGEFGFDHGLDPDAAEHAAKVLDAAGKARVRYAVWWQIFDQPPIVGLGDKGFYGLYDQDVKITPIGKKFLSAMQ